MPKLPLCTPRVGSFASNPPRATYGPRQMLDYEFVWMVRGRATYHWADCTVEVPEGAVVLCRPGAEDAFDWDPAQRSLHGYLHFDLRRPRPRHWPAEDHWPLVRPLPDGDVFRPLLRHLLVSLGRGHPDHLALSLEHLVSSFLLDELATQPAPDLSLPEPVAAVLRHIAEQLQQDATRPIDLDELAAVAHRHPASLCRRFRTATGYGPIETVRLARLDLALQRLTRSDSPIKAIADDVGFASPYHFSRCFKAAFGLAPSQVRDQMQRGETPPLPRLHAWPGMRPD